MMKNLKHSIGFVALSIILSCNTQKNTTSQNHDEHSHDGQSSHSHNDYFGSYTLDDNSYKTKTVMTVKGDTKTMVMH